MKTQEITLEEMSCSYQELYTQHVENKLGSNAKENLRILSNFRAKFGDKLEFEKMAFVVNRTIQKAQALQK